MSASGVNKTIKKEEGKLKKILAIVKKVLSKEFLWALFVFLLSIPIALICAYLIDIYASKEVKEIFELITGYAPTFTVTYIICVVGIYFSRAVKVAIETQVASLKK